MTTRRPKPDEALPPPVLVEDSHRMEALLRDIQGAEEISVDTEGDSFYRYEERVCLIQITVEDRDYIVDPLRGFELGGFGEVLADPTKTKVFHDGEYDIRILKRCYGFSFAGLFDTRVAAAALGYESPGLASVVEHCFGIELDKSLQRSNWSSRPLTPSQIDYARLDTHYLIPLMRELARELDARGRRMVVEGECRRLEALEPGERVFNPDEFLRLKGARNLDPAQQRSLRELYVMRDELACQRDVPPFKVLNNQVLIDVARAQAGSLRRLERLERLSPKLIKRWGDQIVSAMRRAREKGPLEQVPRLPARDGTGGLDETGLELHERLKEWRKEEAKSREMDASLILNRHVMVRLASARPRDAAALEAVEGLLPWQLELFGDAILRVVARLERDVAEGRVPANGRSRRRSRRGRDAH